MTSPTLVRRKAKLRRSQPELDLTFRPDESVFLPFGVSPSQCHFVIRLRGLFVTGGIPLFSSPTKWSTVRTPNSRNSCRI
jgi:hypothetical protein